MVKRIIRFRGKERKEDIVMLNNKFMGARGSGIAKRFRKRR